MNFNGVVVNEKGLPYPGVKVGIVDRNVNGYSINDVGIWAVTDENGLYNIYPDTLGGKVVVLFGPEARNVAVYSPATDYQGQTISLDSPGKMFPWWVLILAIGGYFLTKKGKR